MFDSFEAYLLSKRNFTKEELAHIVSACTFKKIRRHQFLLQEGDVCNTKIFVVKGLLRAYQLTDSGAEHIMRFATENAWILDYESYTFGTPSRFYIDAVENAEVILLTKENAVQLFDTMPSFRSMSEELKEQTMKDNQQRILMNISYTAEEKYRAFVEANENVFRRVPLHMVASYLGVSRETLSRVRHSEYERSKKNKVG